jgi:8-oxo-dGTP pyrophosphatase MutT (NUDIX family)
MAVSSGPGATVEAMEVKPLSDVPELILVDRPPLPDALLAQAELLHRELLALPDGYDDPTLVCLEANVARALVYQVPYSLGQVIYEAKDRSFGLGGVAAKLLLEDDSTGERLWQLRSAHVLQPHTWSWSVAGAVDPSETSLQAIRREAQEELGVAASALEELEPLAFLNGRGFSVLFRARLQAGVELHPNAGEVAELRFAVEPPEPRTTTVALTWSKVRALLQQG